MTTKSLEDQLAENHMPAGWKTIIDRLYAQKTKHPCGAATAFGGGRYRMEVAFRTWADHFTLFRLDPGKGDRVVKTFDLDETEGLCQISP